jgi:hypothetical protein
LQNHQKKSPQRKKPLLDLLSANLAQLPSRHHQQREKNPSTRRIPRKRNRRRRRRNRRSWSGLPSYPSKPDAIPPFSSLASPAKAFMFFFLSLSIIICELLRRARETVTAREIQEQKEAEEVRRKEEEFLQRKKESRDLLGETIKREMAASELD